MLFLYISLSSLYDYDVKMPNFTLYRGIARKYTGDNEISSLLWFLGIQLWEGSLTFDKVSNLELLR